MILKSPTLGAILTRRIAFFAVLAMVMQLAVSFSGYYWNVGALSRLFVEQETERLASGVTVEESGTVRYRLPDSVKARYGEAQTGYVARIRGGDGELVFQSCDAACEDRFLPPDVNPPDFWLRSVAPGKPLTLVGGRAFTIGGQRFVIDVATTGDPQDVISDFLWNEVIADMTVPISILLVLVLGATLLSVRQALKPVQTAAEAAERIDPMDSRSHLQFHDMPREVAHLAGAVNRAFERVGELMKSQNILTSGIAHEVLTPLAAFKLDLGRIDHPWARKAEADIDDLVRFVSQITALARLNTFDHGTFEEVDLVELSAGVVEQLAPWVEENDHSLELSAQIDTAIVQGVPALLKDAVRNLIDNAVRHTPAQTAITVRVSRNLIRIEDRHSAGNSHCGDVAAHAVDLEIGLEIVERIAALHRGSLRRSAGRHGRVFDLEIGA